MVKKRAWSPLRAYLRASLSAAVTGAPMSSPRGVFSGTEREVLGAGN